MERKTLSTPESRTNAKDMLPKPQRTAAEAHSIADYAGLQRNEQGSKK
jgi:hypothetical protein